MRNALFVARKIVKDNVNMKLFTDPVHKELVLATFATSKGPAKPVHLRGLTRTLPAHGIMTMEVDDDFDLSPLDSSAITYLDISNNE